LKILHRDKKDGVLKLKLENPNDIWELENVLKEGDFIGAKTLRRKMIQRKDGQEKGEKRPVYLTIELEKIKFHEHTGNLRLTGPIVGGPDDVDMDSYHTIKAEPGKVLSVTKKDGWKQWELETIKRAYRKPPKVLVCVLDRNSATIAKVESSVEIISKIDSGISGKQYEAEYKDRYIGDILSTMKRKADDYEKIIIAGPGFMKEELMSRIEDGDLEDKVVKDSISQTGETGIQEVIKRGTVERIARNSRISEETGKIEEVFEELSKNTGKVAYGKDEVKRAVELGAVKRAVVSKKFIKSNQELIEKIEERGGEVTICSERHESGEKLGGIGGIAAILRYKID